MIDEKRLIEELKNLQVTVNGLRARKGILRELIEQFREGVLRIIDEQPKADNWIPRKTKPPVIGQCVIICTRNRDVGEGRLMVKSQSVLGVEELEWEQFRWNTRIPLEEVVKWQPMPDAFEGDDT